MKLDKNSLEGSNMSFILNGMIAKRILVRILDKLFLQGSSIRLPNNHPY